ncbi:MAG: PilN domain-containing protein [Chthonomonas sp.]|nr:PilN domain-containing protein [Chthonomonas sp.]
MPNINLIREQRILVRAQRRKTKLVSAGALGISVLALGFLGMQWMNLSGKRAALVDAKQKHERIYPKVEQIDELTALVGKLEPKMQNLDDSQRATKRWFRILNHLAKNTPPDAWLTQIRSTQTMATEPVALTIQGISGGQGSAADMMNRLQASTDYEGVVLNYTNEEVSTDRTGIKFELTARVAGTAQPKPKEEEEKA